MSEIGKLRWETEEFSSWSEFRDYLEDDLSPAYTLFRGQHDADWGLCTSLDRLIQTLPIGFRNERMVNLHLERFKKAARGRRLGADHRPEDQNVWWALGQHYGLATPLLDWSDSAYIAAYFAFSDPTEADSGKRAIWAFVPNAVIEANKAIINEFKSGFYAQDNRILEKSRAPTVEIVEPDMDDNPRLINQAGSFTRSPISVDLQKWIELNNGRFTVPLLKKLVIPDDERHDALRALQKMNIHSQSMFPDLVGASLYCNEMLSLQADVMSVNDEAMRILKVLEKDNTPGT